MCICRITLFMIDFFFVKKYCVVQVFWLLDMALLPCIFTNSGFAEFKLISSPRELFQVLPYLENSACKGIAHLQCNW